MKKILNLIIIFSLLFTFLLQIDTFAREMPPEVDKSNPYYHEIKYLYDRWVIDNPDYTMEVLDRNSNRRLAVIAIAQALGLEDTKKDIIFSDVESWINGAGLIQSAVEKGIVTGYPDGTFRPSEELTRGHFATFLVRAFGEYLPDSNVTFKDVPEGHTAYNAVGKLVGAGITTGYPDGTFRPNEKLTNKHVILFMYRTVKYLEEQGYSIPFNSEIDDSKIKLGMTYEDVYEIVKKKVFSMDNSRIYTNVSRNNTKGTTDYIFESGILKEIIHMYDVSDDLQKVNTLSDLHILYLAKNSIEFDLDSDNTDHKEYLTSTSLTYKTTWNYENQLYELRTMRGIGSSPHVYLSIKQE